VFLSAHVECDSLVDLPTSADDPIFWNFVLVFQGVWLVKEFVAAADGIVMLWRQLSAVWTSGGISAAHFNDLHMTLAFSRLP